MRSRSEIDDLFGILVVQSGAPLSQSDSPTPAYPLGPALDFMRRLWRLNHALERRSVRMEQTIGVTAQQRLVLRCVGSYPGISSGRLAETLHLDPGTVSSSLRRLEAAGLLERRRDPADARRVLLGLTSEGHALNRRGEGTVEEAVLQMFSQSTEDELAAALRVVDRLASALEAEVGTDRRS